MPFLLNANLKSDMWSKHKSILTGSTGIGDKLKVLEAAAKCDENDAAGLAKLDQAINGLLAIAVPAFNKAKTAKTIPATTSKYLQDMVTQATALRKLVAEKHEAAKGEQKESESEETPRVTPAPGKAPPQTKPNRPLPTPPSQKKGEEKESESEESPRPTARNVPPPPPGTRPTAPNKPPATTPRPGRGGEVEGKETEHQENPQTTSTGKPPPPPPGVKTSGGTRPLPKAPATTPPSQRKGEKEGPESETEQTSPSRPKPGR